MPPAKRKTPAAAPEKAATSGEPGARHEAFGVHLPFLSVSVTRPAPGGAASSSPSGAAPQLPRLLFYGGVAALGVAGLVEWPVAAAIAAGTWVASRARSAERGHAVAGGHEEQAEPGAR